MSNIPPLNQSLTMVQTRTLLMESESFGSLSPVEEHTDFLDEAGRLAMIDTGLVDKQGEVSQQWQAAVHVLVDPEAVIQVAVAGRLGVRLLHGYLSPALSENLVGFTPTPNNEYSLAWPLRDDHILAMLVSGLGLDEDVPEQGISEILSVDALVAMAGFADALRSKELSNMLARVTDRADGTDLDHVIISANEGLHNEDRRWASTLLRDLLPDAPEPKKEKITNGLKELATTGWLQEKKNNYWVMSDTGRTVFTHWQMVMASAMLNITEVSRQQKFPLGMIRTIASLWTVQQTDSVKNGRKLMRIEMTSSLELLESLQKQIEGAFCVKRQDSPDDTAVPSCPHCNARIVPGARFCSKCGGQLNE